MADVGHRFAIDLGSVERGLDLLAGRSWCRAREIPQDEAEVLQKILTFETSNLRALVRTRKRSGTSPLGSRCLQA